ncbi:uncharacterized protein N7483_000401 [Penicillium malachiteum]|uniref:uncharacterized protein n=1 Tax=Penicillium malachiteum TaxID=1324776 RepID=UPI00254904C8|nr:uncharacterized protein N7483_000401 [Penicillium malachiteum]KAJ5735276.1 hypothetical protein N7483_000401 [Penicillium malachiteum]
MNTVTNADVIINLYRIGEKSVPISVVDHTGELAGYLFAYWTFPEEESSVVVLCNSFQLNGDPTNIVAQAITQALFDLQPKVDFIAIAKDVVKNAKARWNNVATAWISNRISGTQPKDTITYNGIFENEGLAMRLSITSLPGHRVDPLNSKKLQLRINNCHKQTFNLYHYHHDAWTILPKDRDECIRNGYSGHLYDWNAFIINFKDFKDGHFGSNTTVFYMDLQTLKARSWRHSNNSVNSKAKLKMQTHSPPSEANIFSSFYCEKYLKCAGLNEERDDKELQYRGLPSKVV